MIKYKHSVNPEVDLLIDLPEKPPIEPEGNCLGEDTGLTSSENVAIIVISLICGGVLTAWYWYTCIWIILEWTEKYNTYSNSTSQDVIYD